MPPIYRKKPIKCFGGIFACAQPSPTPPPIRRWIRFELGQGRADQNEREVGARSAGELSVSRRLALGSFARLFLLPSVQRRVGVLQNSSIARR